jgi:hypothetical protein
VATPEPDDVPKLPRSRGLKLSRPQLIRIALTSLLLVLIVVIQKPCANTVSTFVTSFGDEGSGGTAMPKPGTVDQQQPASDLGSASDYETIPENMTEADYKAMVERQKAKQAAKRAGSGSGSGSAAAP